MAIEFTDLTTRGPRTARRGGGVAKTPDVQRLARALRGPGNDTRRWIEAGTVGHEDDQGEFRTDDPEAVFVDRLGAVVSVRLEPSGEIVTARYNGISCGRFGFMLIPIVPGDEVLVSIPSGDMNSPAITIIAIESDETAQIPQNWKNDRVLFDLNVPFEIRAPAVKIRSGNLQLNGRQVVFGPRDI